MRTRRLNHSVYRLAYHIVWGTKYRRKILKPYVRKELIKSLYRTQRRYPTLYFHTINTGDDHVHLYMEVAPKTSISTAVQRLKAHSSRHLKEKFDFIRNRVYKDTGIWSVGYFVSSVGINERVIRRYIENQHQYDIGRDAQEELGLS